jgi:hypothetical protein
MEEYGSGCDIAHADLCGKMSRQNANGPGSPRPFARTDNLVPRQGQIPLSRRSLLKSSYFRRAAPRPATSPHVPERQLLLTKEKVDLKGFEPSPLTLTGSYAAVTPQAHAESIGLRGLLAMLIAKNLSTQVSFQECRPNRNANGPGSPRPLASVVARAGSSPSLQFDSE